MRERLSLLFLRDTNSKQISLGILRTEQGLHSRRGEIPKEPKDTRRICEARKALLRVHELCSSLIPSDLIWFFGSLSDFPALRDSSLHLVFCHSILRVCPISESICFCSMHTFSSSPSPSFSRLKAYGRS